MGSRESLYALPKRGRLCGPLLLLPEEGGHVNVQENYEGKYGGYVKKMIIDKISRRFT